MYLFYLGNIQLPVAPSKLEVKISNQNKTVTLINEGEINLLKSPGLTEIRFTCLLPAVKYPWAKYPASFKIPTLYAMQRGAEISEKDGFKNPSYYLAILESYKVCCQPFDFIVIRTLDDGTTWEEDTRMTVTIEDYTITENAADGRDMAVDIKLKQYKAYGTKTITVTDGAATVTTPRTNTISAVRAETYTVVQGDTLLSIAKIKLGASTRWTEIYSLNKDIIESTAKKNGRDSSSTGLWLYPGTVLRLPG